MSEYYVRHLQASIPLAAADRIVDAVLAAGVAEGMLPLTAAVLDVGGNLVVVKRADGSGILRVDIAIGKAWGALGMGISSRTIRDRLKDRPAFW
jgi:glc operon protein GlcG